MKPESIELVNIAFTLWYPTRIRMDSLGQQTLQFEVKGKDEGLEIKMNYKGHYNEDRTTYIVAIP